jgi:hypothetical protein
MGHKAQEFRAKADELEERAQTVINREARSTLLETARQWRKLAREVERYGDERASRTRTAKPQGRTASH